MPNLNLAVVGAGLIGRRHIELVWAHGGCDLVAIADPAAPAQQLAESLGVRCYSGLTDLLVVERLDGVILATPNSHHVDQCLACVATGVPVLVEKPVADTYAAGQQLRTAVEGAGVPVIVGHHRVHSPILQRAVDIVAGGVLGDIVTVSGSALFYKPDDYFAAAPWRTQPGGGPVLINFIHDVGNLRALCGEIAEVQAFTSNQARGHAVEDTASIGLRFVSGAVGSFVISDVAASARSWEQTSGENEAYARYDGEDCYQIAGTRGSLAVPTMRLQTYPQGTAPSWYAPFETNVVDVSRDDPLRLQLDHFCEVIRGEAEPRVTVRDGLQNLRVTEAVSQSAATGRTVTTFDA